MSYCPVCADLLREKQELEARVRELEAREEVLQRALDRWLPSIAGADDLSPMHKAASEDASLLYGGWVGEGVCFGDDLIARAEQAEAALSVAQKDAESLDALILEMYERANANYDAAVKERRDDDANEAVAVIATLNRIGRHVGVLVDDIAHGGAGEGEGNGR